MLELRGVVAVHLTVAVNRIVLLGATLACLFCVACGGTLPVPHQWMEPQSDRNNSGFNALRTVDATSSVRKWSAAVGPLVFSTPVVGADGTVFIGNAAGEAVGVNPDGTVRFRYHIGGSILGSPAVDPVSGDVIFIAQNPVSPQDAGSFLYRLSPNGIVQASSAENLNTTGAPQIWHDYVFVVGTGYLFVFDRVNLSLVAKAWLWSHNCDPLICAGSDPWSIFSTIGETLSCTLQFWPADCLAKLEPGPMPEATPAVLDGRAFTEDPNHPLVVITNRHCPSAWRFRPDAAPEERLQYVWDQKVVNVSCDSKRVRPTSAAIVAGQAVFGDQQGRVRSIAPGDGQQLWTTELRGAVMATPVAYLRQIYVVLEHALVVLDSDGTVLSETPLNGAGRMAAHTLDRIYVATTVGVHTFPLNPTEGATFDSLPGGEPAHFRLRAGLAVAQDGTIYVSMPGGDLHAYGPRPR
jgi:outer membrane protein assembly factor BamB